MPAVSSISLCPPPAAAPPRNAFPRLLREKLLLSICLSIAFCLPYFAMQHFPLTTPRLLPATWIDRAIPFQPAWVYVYQSIYLLLPIPPFLAPTRRSLSLYARSFCCTGLIGLSLLYLFPTTIPRQPHPDAPAMYAWLIRYDGPINACPSMHVALAAQSLLYALHTFRSPAGRVLTFLGFVWLVGIAYSTLAIREHYAVDLPAGFLVALLAHFLARRFPMGAA